MIGLPLNCSTEYAVSSSEKDRAHSLHWYSVMEKGVEPSEK